ncbi:hypothetical protein TL16_g07746 [Triparma laevis f. inornata]|uniref:Uncharacterized protein n=1 Tax=Triparma laevis f. inornata TaxID=1714386 RepID=A0A9W7EGW8_9STRA|nr:hypothetical protein TL16_g07746 [Triparma laevis f. inornata]
MGTTLTMSVIVVVGTLLPLLLDPTNKLLTIQGLTICFGLAVCGLSFWAAAVALKRKDIDEENASKIEMKKVNAAAVVDVVDVVDVEAVTVKSQTPFPNSPNPPTRRLAVVLPPTYSTFYKVMVCCISGILCTMLQFAFVFSSPLRTIAEETHSLSPVRSAGITFIFAITICPIPNILIPLYTLKKNNTLASFTSSPHAKSNLLKCILIMSTPWVIQSHLYGLAANSLLGDYGDAIGWPLLIVTTNVTGLIIGWRVLGEWKEASEGTIKCIVGSIGFSIVGLGIVSAGGFV